VHHPSARDEREVEEDLEEALLPFLAARGFHRSNWRAIRSHKCIGPCSFGARYLSGVHRPQVIVTAIVTTVQRQVHDGFFIGKAWGRWLAGLQLDPITGSQVTNSVIKHSISALFAAGSTAVSMR
jgi:hypothetical protein